MKTIMKLSLLIAILAIALTTVGCDSDAQLTVPAAFDQTVQIRTTINNPSTDYPIWAGQNINAGTMTVSNDNDNLYISYNMSGDWQLKATHLHIASSLAGIPKNKAGVPIPGQFMYSTTHNPFVTSYTYQFSLSSLGYGFGSNIVIAAHAEVTKYNPTNLTWQNETGWGGNVAGPGNRWWFYAPYTIVQPTRSGDPTPFVAETAMIRMNDVANDFSFPWGTHPWFSYVKHTPDNSPDTFYFYAAQHYRVGEVKVWKDANSLYVQIDLDGNYEMQQSHLNVQLTGYSGNPAFGLFPYKVTHSPRVKNYTYQIPWNAAWTGNELNISLHGEVGPF